MRINIETERLMLRNYRIGDAGSMYENFYKDAEIARYMAWYPHADIEVTKEKLTKDILPNIDSAEVLYAAITKKEAPDVVIGNFKAVIQNECAVIGYMLGAKFQHHGYMQETCTAVIDYLFQNTKIDKIHACFEKENTASGMVLKKLGFEKTGTEYEKRKIDSREEDVVLCLSYELTEDQWVENKQRAF
jgi:ribosomal-protein-alanine N-acetyltransferase